MALIEDVFSHIISGDSWRNYLDDSVPVNFYHHFRNNILRFNKRWNKSIKVEERSFGVGLTTYWIICIRVKTQVRYFREYGVGTSRSRALDTSSYRLYKYLNERFARFILPSHIIGFPNIRGHCFLISAILPLFHSFPFVHNLIEVFGKLSLRRNHGEQITPPDQRDEIEVPYYWTNLLFNLYLKYHKVSISGVLNLENANRLAMRLMKAPVVFLPYIGDKGVVELDRLLISGLCSSLRDYCNNFYNEPGGFEKTAFSDIMFKLSSEDVIWQEEFFLQFKCTYYCRRCTSVCPDQRFRVPVINLCPFYEVQELLDVVEALLSCQEIICTKELNGFQCGGAIRKVTTGFITNKPKVICLSAPEGLNFENIKIPEEIYLTVDGEKIYYERLASSNCFNCWKSKNDKDYGAFYHEYEEGDKLTGGHTYVTMKTTKGFYEINNGMLFTLDTRLFQRITAGSIHFFQRKEYGRE
uniref:4Fe-4S ferredoxin-type domain-containing protein n=1 Tax=Tetranychus urticae TaxID=32264 RepID=T1K206_TETUR